MQLLVVLSLFKIARVQYDGGGDWYNDPEIIPNLLNEVKKVTNIEVDPTNYHVKLIDTDLYSFPFLFITGHGNISFSEKEVENLREFLENGGFLYADDDYGMDQSFRKEMKKVFPDIDFVELPASHKIFHSFYDFPGGVPQIHKHYEGRPKAFGLFFNENLVCLYTYNSNISDGWTDRYNDPSYKREEAIKMGINIIVYSLFPEK